MQQVKEILDLIINQGLKKSMKEEGYRKTSHTFKYFGEDFVKIVNIQASPWNTKDDGKFTMNLGVYFPKLAKVHDYINVKNNPSNGDCLVFQRIGFLLSEKRDFWWSINKTSSVSQLSDELSDSWIRYEKPWIDKHSDLFEARKFYLTNYDFPYIVAMMSVVLGDLEMATQMANKTIDAQPEMFERVSKWAKKNKIKLNKAD